MGNVVDVIAKCLFVKSVILAQIIIKLSLPAFFTDIKSEVNTGVVNKMYYGSVPFNSSEPFQ